MRQKMLTTEQAATLYGVTVGAVKYWIRTGRLKAQKVGRDWVIPAGQPRPRLVSGRAPKNWEALTKRRKKVTR